MFIYFYLLVTSYNSYIITSLIIIYTDCTLLKIFNYQQKINIFSRVLQYKKLNLIRRYKYDNGI